MSKTTGTVNEYRNYYLPPHFPVLLLSGEHWKISDIPSGRLHFHNCMEIGLCHSDSGFMEFYGERVPFQAGDVTVIPRNVPHTTYSSPNTASHWSYLFLDPKELFQSVLPASWNDYDLLTYHFRNFKFVFSREQYPTIHNLFLLIIEELNGQKPGYQFSARGLLLSLYIEIYRAQTLENTETIGQSLSISADTLSIAPALDYIETNYMHQFGIEDLAELCHWSPTHFRRVFHSIMGVSPLAYVNNTRILKSCDLLCSTEDSILSISEACGFQTVSSYNRYFSRVMQLSPREYRRKMQQDDKQQIQNLSVLEYSGWMRPEY